jgi:hypothetical protein
VRVTIDLRSVRRTAGDFNIGDLSQAIGRELEKAADQVVKNIARRIKALCFTPTINEAKIFAQLCRDRGVAADYVSGECSDRTEKIARFRNGETKLLANCAVLTEGFDCPDIDTIVLLRPTQSRSLLCQQIGRATRLWTGKEFGLLLDFFWLTARHRLCAPGDIDGVEKEPSPCDELLGPGGSKRSLADKLSDEGGERRQECALGFPAEHLDLYLVVGNRNNYVRRAFDPVIDLSIKVRESLHNPHFPLGVSKDSIVGIQEKIGMFRPRI